MFGHVSNLYHIPEQQKLAKKLCDISFADKVFFAIQELKLLKEQLKPQGNIILKKVIKIEQKSLLLRMRSMEGL